MDIHKNARSCPASREVLVRRVLRQGWSVAEGAADLANWDRADVERPPGYTPYQPTG